MIPIKIGRNTRCFCGSGKKYKVCCLPKKLEIEKDIRNGAQYVKGNGLFGLVKIANAPGETSLQQTQNYEVEYGAASITDPKVSS